MFTRKQFMAVAALMWTSAAVIAAPVRIDFADDSSIPTPGFMVQPVGAMSPISDSLRIGSNVPGHVNGLDFLRITSATSTTQGSEVLGFIVTLPDFTIANIGGANGVGVDTYQLSFAGGNPTFAANGFGIYALSDTGLTLPLLTADLNLLDRTLFLFGASGSIESSVGLNLTNVQTPNGGNLITTLREFQQDAISGASFVAGISSASVSQSISQRIMARALVNGSSSGSVESVIPEPATLILLATGALIASRRKVMIG